MLSGGREYRRTYCARKRNLSQFFGKATLGFPLFKNDRPSPVEKRESCGNF